MDYTAEQIVKMIVLAETLLNFRAIVPVDKSPMMIVDFHTFDEVSIFELALDEAVASLRPPPSFAETLNARASCKPHPGITPSSV